jgi:hypothetical protein
MFRSLPFRLYLFLQNYGSVSNKGVELAISSTNIDTKDFKWTSSFNLSKNKNKIEKLGFRYYLGRFG